MTSPPSRYFIGLALPEELSGKLFDFKRQLHTDIINSLAPLVPHITLLHPSTLENSSPDEILPRTKEIAAAYLPFTVSLETVDAFGRQVLYIALHSPDLEELQPRIVSTLPPHRQAIYHQRPYAPHITLVQVRSPQTLDVEALRQRTQQSVNLPQSFTISSLFCFTQVGPREYRGMPF